MDSAAGRGLGFAKIRGIGLSAAAQPMIAIIDRDRLTAFGLALLLRDWGYETVSGSTASEIFGRIGASGGAIAAIVADDRIEGGTTGGDEAAALAALARRPIPIVVIGGEDPGAPGIAQIAKPIEPMKLRDLLATMLRIDRSSAA